VSSAGRARHAWAAWRGLRPTRRARGAQVRVWVPAGVMRRAQARLVAGGPREQVLTVELRSDFHTARAPLEARARPPPPRPPPAAPLGAAPARPARLAPAGSSPRCVCGSGERTWGACKETVSERSRLRGGQRRASGAARGSRSGAEALP